MLFIQLLLRLSTGIARMSKWADPCTSTCYANKRQAALFDNASFNKQNCATSLATLDILPQYDLFVISSTEIPFGTLLKHFFGGGGGLHTL